MTPHSGIFSEKGASGSYWSEVSSKSSLSQLPLKLMVMPTGCPQVELPSPCHSCQDAEAASANLATLALQTPYRLQRALATHIPESMSLSLKLAQ